MKIMANGLLTCFTQSKPLCTNEPGFDLFSSLAIDLKHLHKSLEQNSPSLRWCSESMLVVKKTHADFLHSFQMSKDPASIEGTYMIDEYMRATLELLDLCNLLKSAVSSLDRYRMMIDFMFKRLKDATFATANSKMELERLDIEKSKYIVKFKKRKEMNFKGHYGKMSNVNSKTKANNMHVLEPIWSTMSTISLSIFCSIINSVPIKTEEGGFRVSDMFPDSVQKLDSTFGEKFQCVQGKGKLILQENQMIDDAFAAIKAKIVSAKEVSEDQGKLPAESLAMLKNRSLALKEGIELFESVVNELFEDVIKGRKNMIDLFKLNNHISR